MPVVVNGYEFTDADMERELPEHQDAADPVKSAMTALVLRRILLQEAQQSGLQNEDEEAQAREHGVVHLRVVLGQVQTAIGRQAFEQDVAKLFAVCVAAGAEVFHERVPSVWFID